MTKMENATNKVSAQGHSVSKLQALFARPDFAALAGVAFVFILFSFVASDTGMFAVDGVLNWTIVSAQLAILATGACLLMIAGEFDLSMGSMIGFSGMVVAIPTLYWAWPLWASILLAFSVSAAIGALIGFTVVRTRLPSFIVSLAFLFILRGLTIALSIQFTNRTIVSGVSHHVEGDWFAALFGAEIGQTLLSWLGSAGLIATFEDGSPLVTGIPMVIVWAVFLVVFAHIILHYSTFGNWIFATGGDEKAARNMGINTAKVKILLFVLTACCATLYATCQVLEFGSAAADRGLLKEFEAIIAVVIGGTLLTGGYGSVIGALCGAIIFGVVQIGIFFTGINTDWFRVILGALLLAAVVFNNLIRQRITKSG
ncbi:ABC transporter permease [Lacimicrobium alkaliphilum]|uniref:Xylose transport system permease protein XylH n=1 Tax=Lacimicrobium alkaliphilum TaxID=1526571 RepID=A0A0U2ZEM4_9ALTE|nr:ABC transporter permease [Lacimicrobium alkaliphilum]ALS97575.1 ATPase [Lacimicrobium alkaliphilum]